LELLEFINWNLTPILESDPDFTAPPKSLRAASLWLTQIKWDLTPFMRNVVNKAAHRGVRHQTGRGHTFVDDMRLNRFLHQL
jgi:hypothetical protein